MKNSYVSTFIIGGLISLILSYFTSGTNVLVLVGFGFNYFGIAVILGRFK